MTICFICQKEKEDIHQDSTFAKPTCRDCYNKTVYKNIPIREMTDLHKCPKKGLEPHKIGKTPFTKDYCLEVYGYLVSAKYCLNCGQKLGDHQNDV